MSNKNKMAVIAYLDEAAIQHIDNQVKSGIYSSRSHFIRVSVLSKLKNETW